MGTTRPSKDNMNFIIVLAAVCVAAGDRRADFKVQAVSFTGHVGGGDDEQKRLEHTDQTAADGIHDPRSGFLGLLKMWNINEMQQINKLVSDLSTLGGLSKAKQQSKQNVLKDLELYL